MYKIIFLVILTGLWFLNQNKTNENINFNENIDFSAPQETYSQISDTEIEDISYSNFTCDGRKYCSKMTSCEEATYFINHCPNTKMDGDGDGVPCERQWCN